MTRPRAYTARKAALVERFGGGCERCGYCRLQRALHFHHVVPRGGGSSRASRETVGEVEANPERFQLLCANCHIEAHEELDRAGATYAACASCGKRFKATAYKVTAGTGRFCSVPCAQDARRVAAMDREGIEARFRAFVRRDGDCWVWTGHATNGTTPVLGVTRATANGKKQGPVTARRVCAELFRPDLLDHARLTVTCGQTLCVNPGHLTGRGHPLKLT